MCFQIHVGEGRVTERSVLTGSQRGKSTGCLTRDFSSAAPTCAHQPSRRYSVPRPPLKWPGGPPSTPVPSPRPRSPRGGVCEAAGASVGGARPARPQPSPAGYLVLAAAPAALVAAQQLRDGQRGCVRLVRCGGQTHVAGTAAAAIAAALHSAHGGGGAGGADKQAARPRPAPVTPPPGRARQPMSAIGNLQPRPLAPRVRSLQTRPAKTSWKARRPARS